MYFLNKKFQFYHTFVCLSSEFSKESLKSFITKSIIIYIDKSYFGSIIKEPRTNSIWETKNEI